MQGCRLRQQVSERAEPRQMGPVSLPAPLSPARGFHIMQARVEGLAPGGFGVRSEDRQASVARRSRRHPVYACPAVRSPWPKPLGSCRRRIHIPRPWFQPPFHPHHRPEGRLNCPRQPVFRPCHRSSAWGDPTGSLRPLQERLQRGVQTAHRHSTDGSPVSVDHSIQCLSARSGKQLPFDSRNMRPSSESHNNFIHRKASSRWTKVEN